MLGLQTEQERGNQQRKQRTSSGSSRFYSTTQKRIAIAELNY
jgi:hypothetical protein